MHEPEQELIVDLRKLRCPMAFVQAKLAILSRQQGKPLVLLLSDRGTRTDVPRWLEKKQITFNILADHKAEMSVRITG
ncbi:sulfurtransferase TusA family protein [Ferrimonas lipolytica]|uniref:Sulfurtransferase TusA family protein n=1 Tax=Ferrimonas lipolytica TaxID=2724191 RepID=A0A6H1UEZ7_9GAMM|nr:sulfurtransferase TusA family protein [Ferrimonas lipolytica]QIZ76913.1 sulfurtransferase TusA family protein [Ferrimonas lipolytica]